MVQISITNLEGSRVHTLGKTLQRRWMPSFTLKMNWGMGVYRMKLKHYSYFQLIGHKQLFTIPANSFIPQIIPKYLHMPSSVFSGGASALNWDGFAALQQPNLPYDSNQLCAPHNSPVSWAHPEASFRGKLILKIKWLVQGLTAG